MTKKSNTVELVSGFGKIKSTNTGCQPPGTKYNLYLQLLERDMLSTIEQMQEGEVLQINRL